jgi:hypothetical protein
MKKIFLFLLLAMPFVFAACDDDDDKGASLTDIEFEEESITIGIGEEYELTLLPIPEKATLPKIIYSSDDEDIASVTKKGVITGESEGKTKIYAESSDGEFTAICRVTVKAGGSGNSSDLYKEPYLKFGCSAADIKKNETRESFSYNGQGENLAFYGENDDVNAVLYIIKSKKMESVGVIFNDTKTIKKRVTDFLNGRYKYLGDEDGDSYFLSDDEKVVVVLMAMEDGTLSALYLNASNLSAPALRNTSSDGLKKSIKEVSDLLRQHRSI